MSTITEAQVPINGMRPIHPGEILREEYLGPLNMTPAEFADKLGLSNSLVNQILNEHAPVSPEIALRFARFWNTSPEFWLNLQLSYSLKVANAEHSKTVDKEIVPFHR